MKTTKIIIALALSASIAVTACDQSRKNVTFGGSKDTTSINKAGGPPIKDTATINADRKQGKMDPAKKDTTAKGNADPTGRTPKH